ncbi:putative protein YaeQ [BD1-7 clade bacterium]|uniref:YaeQ family protein n=1 Tax=BD1-7 clade bacterium TaxID=2029982 RepID=A0A5S9N121_9GAMM|nr:putative protein YaeQ [BD1-7 clade bacterium]CAA0082876.1 putative protein YaeQ [BD1-7 clade bacterium]
MALKATVFKLQLNVSDLNRHHYQDYALTVARHPSETDERMMVRIVAFALNAADNLSFGRGLSTDDEPDLWQQTLTGDISHWIDVGQPSEDRIRKACSRAQAVTVYAYGTDKVQHSWKDGLATLSSRFDRLHLRGLNSVDTADLVKLVNPTMQLQCTLDGADIWLGDTTHQCQLALRDLQE